MRYYPSHKARSSFGVAGTLVSNHDRSVNDPVVAEIPDATGVQCGDDMNSEAHAVAKSVYAAVNLGRGGCEVRHTSTRRFAVSAIFSARHNASWSGSVESSKPVRRCRSVSPSNALPLNATA